MSISIPSTPPLGAAIRSTPPQAMRSAEESHAYLTSITNSYYYDPAVFASPPTCLGGSCGNGAQNVSSGVFGSFPTSGASTALGAETNPYGMSVNNGRRLLTNRKHSSSAFNSTDAADTAFSAEAYDVVANSPHSPTDWANSGFRFGGHALARRTTVDTPPLQMQALRRCAIVTGNSHPQLAVDVAALLGKDLHPVSVNLRSSGEINVKIHESVNDKEVFIVHSMCARDSGHDINEGVMELLFLIRKLRQAYASSITAVVPHMAYGRQDHKTELRVPISSSSLALMMMQMGVDRVVSLDLHSGQIQGAFNAVPVDALSFLHEFAQYIRQQPWLEPPNTVMVSPDANGVERAKRLGDVIGAKSVVTIVKRRLEGGKVDCMQAVGEVRGKLCIIVDDIIDSGTTLMAAVDLLREMGAARIIACVTHGVMTDKCSAKVAACEALSQLVVSDSIPQTNHKALCGDKLVVLPTAPLLAMSILQGLRNSSAGSLFAGPTDKEQLEKLVHAQLL